MKIVFDQPAWVAKDIERLHGEWLADEITLQQLEDGMDDVFGVDGGCGHAIGCCLFMPSGSCTCGGWDGKVPQMFETYS